MKTSGGPRRFRGVKFFFKVFLISLSAGVLIVGIALVGIWHFKDRIIAYVMSSIPEQTLPVIADTPVIPIASGEVTASTVVPEPVSAPLSVTDVVNKSNNSVVSISLSNSAGTTTGKGTGFFVSTDGLIVTNRHVVGTGSGLIAVTTTDGIERAASLVATDPVLDIAIIRVPGKNFTPLDLGDSDRLSSGQSVVAIGYALGTFQNSVSVGVISGLSRSVIASGQNGEAEYLDQVIQTDAAINRGNSGGPLLNLEGKVVGVNVATATTSQSIGFALPINDVRQAIISVQKTGRIIRPFVGVRYTQITSDVAKARGLSVSYGVLIGEGKGATEVAVLPGSPAEKAGILSGDIILTLDGVKLDQAHSFASLIRQKTVGSTVSVKIVRGGSEQMLRITLSEAPLN